MFSAPNEASSSAALSRHRERQKPAPLITFLANSRFIHHLFSTFLSKAKENLRSSVKNSQLRLMKQQLFTSTSKAPHYLFASINQNSKSVEAIGSCQLSGRHLKISDRKKGKSFAIQERALSAFRRKFLFSKLWWIEWRIKVKTQNFSQLPALHSQEFLTELKTTKT